MLKLNSKLGARAEERFSQEEIIWLTTVDKQNGPQPRPVWFYWNGSSFLIFSQPKAAKVRHIGSNPRVALNLHADEHGDDVIVILGTAEILANGAPQTELKAFLEKYAEGIRGLGMTPEQMQAEYSTPIRITPTGLRGF